MKILCLADLHLNGSVRGYPVTYSDRQIRAAYESRPEIVLIAGDVFEARAQCNPHKQLAKMFPHSTVIAVLGNHEFFGRTVAETHDYYRETYRPDKYNVHYLDIIGHYDIGNVRFVGNVLWYDGSTKTIQNQDLNKFADGTWMDATIKEFDWHAECMKCVEQIRSNIDESKTNILLTHCVPHIKLNMHPAFPAKPYNAFSGVADLFTMLYPQLAASTPIKYAVCGHTHCRTVGQIICGCNCINVGNDYTSDTSYFEFEIDERTGR